MKMRAEIVEIVGKTICGLIEVEVSGQYSKVYLFFTDGTHCELFSDNTGGIGSTHGAYPGTYEQMHQTISNEKAYQIIKECYLKIK